MHGWHSSPWMWLFMVLFWAIVIALAYYAIRRRPRHLAARSGDEAGDILDTRFARGDITSEEYRASRETPKSSRHPVGGA